MDSETFSKLLNGMSSDFDIVKQRLNSEDIEYLQIDREQASDMIQAFGHTIITLRAYKLITYEQADRVITYINNEVEEIMAIIQQRTSEV